MEEIEPQFKVFSNIPFLELVNVRQNNFLTLFTQPLIYVVDDLDDKTDCTCFNCFPLIKLLPPSPTILKVCVLPAWF
jgi:hypothetical protein